MIPAPHVEATATIKTAQVNANCDMVPQIPSGRANSTASPTANAPAWAVATRRALKSAQQGPTISRAIKIIRDPRSASPAVMTSMMATLNLKKNRRVLSVTRVNIAAGPQ
jgi:hypothetical protein